MDLVPQGGGFFNAAGFEDNFEPEVARLPTDLTPCAAEATGVCFACVYGSQMTSDSKAKPVYEELVDIIKSMYAAQKLRCTKASLHKSFAFVLF